MIDDVDSELSLVLEEYDNISNVVNTLHSTIIRKGSKKKKNKDTEGSESSDKNKLKGKKGSMNSSLMSSVSSKQIIKSTTTDIKKEREDLSRRAREEASKRRLIEKEQSREQREARKLQREKERKEKRELQEKEREERNHQRLLEREKRKLDRVVSPEEKAETPLALAAKELKMKLAGLERSQSNRELVDAMRAKKAAKKKQIEERDKQQLVKVALELQKDSKQLALDVSSELAEAEALQREAQLLIAQNEKEKAKE